jgi:selenocysteine-specific elongation factor
LLDADFFYLSGNAKPLKNRSRVRVHIGTAEIFARIVLLEDEELAPGSRANVQILLEEPFGAWPGDRYVVRSYSPVATIGGGGIWNGSPPKRRRFKEANSQVFALYQTGSPEDISLLHLREAGVSGLTFEALCVKMGQFGKRFRKLLDTPISSRKIIMVDSERQRMVAAEIFEAVGATLTKILADFHRDNSMKPGLSREELRSRLHGEMDQRFFQLLLNTLGKQGTIVVDEATVRLAGHQVSLKADAQSVRAEMEAFYTEAGLTPPTLREVQERFAKYSAPLVREVLDLLVREQVLVKISEDLYFQARALNGLQEQLVAFIKQEGEIDAPRFKNLTGLTRKFSIPLLEYFDKIKVTIRVGDRRLLRERIT